MLEHKNNKNTLLHVFFYGLLFCLVAIQDFRMIVGRSHGTFFKDGFVFLITTRVFLFVVLGQSKKGHEKQQSCHEKEFIAVVTFLGMRIGWMILAKVGIKENHAKNRHVKEEGKNGSIGRGVKRLRSGIERHLKSPTVAQTVGLEGHGNGGKKDCPKEHGTGHGGQWSCIRCGADTKVLQRVGIHVGGGKHGHGGGSWWWCRCEVKIEAILLQYPVATMFLSEWFEWRGIIEFPACFSVC